MTTSLATPYSIGDDGLNAKLTDFVVIELSDTRAFERSWRYIVEREAALFDDGSPQWLTWMVGGRSFDNAATSLFEKALKEKDLTSRNHLSYVKGALGMSPTNVVPERFRYSFFIAPLALRHRAVIYMQACYDRLLSPCGNNINYSVAAQAGIVGQIARMDFDEAYYNDVWVGLKKTALSKANESQNTVAVCVDRTTGKFFSVRL